MPSAAAIEMEPYRSETNLEGETPGAEISKWFALWTRSHCEQLVHDQLKVKGFDLFLPKIGVWSRRAGLKHVTSIPMFPGYLFLRHAMDKQSYIEIRKARGLVSILGQSWDRLAAVSEKEIETIQKVLSANVSAMPYPYLREGQRVRILRGPLANVEGILQAVKADKGFLVISVELLQRSVAIEIDCTVMAPA